MLILVWFLWFFFFFFFFNEEVMGTCQRGFLHVRMNSGTWQMLHKVVVGEQATI